jgi:lysophospholipase L1-like esterase
LIWVKVGHAVVCFGFCSESHCNGNAIMAGLTKWLFRSLLFGAFVCINGMSFAQSPAPPYISWEVKNRFRLFAHEADFEHQAAAYQTASTQTASLDNLTLYAERVLAQQSLGRGWARGITSTCFDSALGKLKRICQRGPDGHSENYINPEDHFVEVHVVLPPTMTDAQCNWTVGEGRDAETFNKPCDQPLSERFRYGFATPVTVVVIQNGATQAQLNTSVQVRDILIVGMGDSIAAGEGNPDQPIALGAADEGFCFDRPLSNGEYAVPTRAAVNVIRDCSDEQVDPIEEWEKTRAGWLLRQCHRSMYGYQFQAALALAVENKQIAVTYVPLGCTGATIKDGLLGRQPARERRWYGQQPEPKYVDGQISQLEAYLQPQQPGGTARKPDLIFLTVGANDIGFSGIVADVIFKNGVERNLIKRAGDIVTPQEASANIPQVEQNFKLLRSALKPFTDGSLSRVVFVSYFNPTRNQNHAVCPSGPRGFDVHPTFSLDNQKANDADKFIREQFLPALKGFALCTGDACADKAHDQMIFVDSHQSAFEMHGVCATSVSDPAFDNECFRSDGTTFNPISNGLTQPLRCGKDPNEFRPYASRQRWIRTPNDTFLAAMTYPAPVYWFLEPNNIHDALWAVLSSVYGGALHPTAEGHAVMADAALVTARQVLHLPPPDFQKP